MLVMDRSFVKQGDFERVFASSAALAVEIYGLVEQARRSVRKGVGLERDLLFPVAAAAGHLSPSLLRETAVGEPGAGGFLFLPKELPSGADLGALAQARLGNLGCPVDGSLPVVRSESADESVDGKVAVG